MRWIRRLDEAAAGPEPCAWIVRLGDPVAEREAATPSRADLAFAARAHAAPAGARRLWRRRLVRALAARWLDAAPDEIVFAAEETFPFNVTAPQRAYVSAATRAPWTVVAAGHMPLGVDVELADADLSVVAALAEELADARLRRWTAAEAYVKATGCGLDAALDLPLRADRLEAPGWPACAIAHCEIGDDALATAATVL